MSNVVTLNFLAAEHGKMWIVLHAKGAVNSCSFISVEHGRYGLSCRQKAVEWALASL